MNNASQEAPSVSLQAISQIYSGGTPDKKVTRYWEDGTIPWINSSSVNQGIITHPSAFITEEAFSNSSTSWAREGDLVIALAGQGKTKGMAAQMGIDACVNQSMSVIHVRDTAQFVSRFLYYCINSQYRNIRFMAGGDKRDGLNLQHIGAIRIPCLPFDSQKRIADYLDRETAEIDAAVADLDRYVELLEKRRRLIITQAVAGIIGPGEGLAEAWDAVPLHSVSAPGGLFVDGDWVETKDQDPNGPIRLMQLADIGEAKFLDKSDRWVNQAKFEELHCTEVLPGDLLIARMPDPIARCVEMPAKLEYVAITVVDVAILRVGTGWNNRYVMWSINCQPFRDDVDSRVAGSTRKRISRSALGRTKLFRPPLDIQQKIAGYLDRETAEIDSLIGESKKLRDLLLKRRSVLITEVVTGRKQV